MIFVYVKCCFLICDKQSGKMFFWRFFTLEIECGEVSVGKHSFGHIEEFLSHVKLSEHILFSRFFLMKTSLGKNNLGLRKNIMFVLLCGTRALFFTQIMNLSFFTNLRNFLSFMCETEWKSFFRILFVMSKKTGGLVWNVFEGKKNINIYINIYFLNTFEDFYFF